MWLFSHWFDNAESPYGILYRDQLSDLSNLMIDRSSQVIVINILLMILNMQNKTYMIIRLQNICPNNLPKSCTPSFYQYVAEGDYAKALELVNNVISTAPSIFKMEPNITKLYEDAWDSNEVLFARYLGQGDLTWDLYNYEYTYSKGLYDSEFRDIPNEWIEKDERHDYTFGEAGGGENWQADIINENVLTKLYHRGAANGPNDKYCTYVFRYAELYLMKAELLARTNPSDIQGALKPLNDMRAQYTTPVMAPITGVTTYEQLMDAIFKEYVVTLLMENETPWFASVRFKKDGKTWLEVLKPDVNISTNKYCWPIPYAEIIAHTNKLNKIQDLNNFKKNINMKKIIFSAIALFALFTACSDDLEVKIPYPTNITFNELKLDKNFTHNVPDGGFSSQGLNFNTVKAADGQLEAGFCYSNRSQRSFVWNNDVVSMDTIRYSVWTTRPNTTETYVVCHDRCTATYV